MISDPTSDTIDPAQYGKEWANEYDTTQAGLDDEIPVQVEYLASLANNGPVLEVAAGTGRVAIPLAETGLEVTASDVSEEMLVKLREKDRNSLVHTEIDKLPEIKGNARYSLIFIILNSIWVLQTAEEQREFFQNAAHHLSQSGHLVVEMWVANPAAWFQPMQATVKDIQMTRTSDWNSVTQRLLHTFKVQLPGHKTPETRKVLARIVFPNELLLMAELAGLYPEETHSDWNGAPFTEDSQRMIVTFTRKK